MEKFNLDKYKTGNYNLVTRCNNPARIICTDYKNEKNIVAIITNKDGKEILNSYYNNGKQFGDDVMWSDLMLQKKMWKPRNQERFFYIETKSLLVIENVYSCYISYHKKLSDSGNCFATREEAEYKLKKIKDIINEDYE